MDWASFRNELAHFYPVVEARKVYEAMDEIDVLETFLAWCEENDSAGDAT